MQSTSWLQYLLSPGRSWHYPQFEWNKLLVSCGKESLSPCSVAELYNPDVVPDVLQTSKHLLTSKREKQKNQLVALAKCSVVCPQAKSGGGVLTREWCALLATNCNFCDLGSIPRVAGWVVQAWKKLHGNIIKQKSTHSSLILFAVLNKGFIKLWIQCYLCVWNQHWCARLAEQTNGASVSGSSRNLYPTNRNAAFFWRWGVFTFSSEKVKDQHPDKLMSSYSGARSCSNAVQLFPWISSATAEVMWGWFCLILLAMCEQSLFWQACWMSFHSSQ